MELKVHGGENWVFQLWWVCFWCISNSYNKVWSQVFQAFEDWCLSRMSNSFKVWFVGEQAVYQTNQLHDNISKIQTPVITELDINTNFNLYMIYKKREYHLLVRHLNILLIMYYFSMFINLENYSQLLVFNTFSSFMNIKLLTIFLNNI